LVFKEKKPLGKNGIRWLKIHLANVFGVDKCSFDERVEFAEANLQNVFASARNPLGGNGMSSDETAACSWWKKADYPFLALGVCFELNRALHSPNPEEYLSNIPVHQDGSCNGLQHYAALGRDASGGAQVNLVPSSRPSDVYTGVAEQVMRKVERDAKMEIPSSCGQGQEQLIKSMERKKQCANFLLGTITRKVVKQTVMTSVYGVTYIGARKQIQARLEETFLTKGHLMDNELENQIYHAACYAAETTMESMGDLFTSARSIMEWLSDCASKVAVEGQPMSWITPMGLPVVQPYRKGGSQQIRTKVQHVLLTVTEKRPVSGGRQKTAFPPNFVHSLDSTHMLMTAVKCLQEDHIAFAAVHDSYWTHACSVDIMNQRLRQEFVHLYEQPLLETLLQQLRLRFPATEFHDVPKLGELKLKDVLESPYFFN
jgi:DNA-directed RNA polymerase